MSSNLRHKICALLNPTYEGLSSIHLWISHIPHPPTTTATPQVLDRTGRRNMTIATTSIIGLCGLLVNAVPSAVASAALFAGFLLGIMTLGLYTAMCVALFPTHLR